MCSVDESENKRQKPRANAVDIYRGWSDGQKRNHISSRGRGSVLSDMFVLWISRPASLLQASERPAQPAGFVWASDCQPRSVVIELYGGV